jgi:hypothetical protein
MREEDHEFLALLERFFPYPKRVGELELRAFLDENGRWTLALLRGEVLLHLDWGYDLGEVEARVWTFLSSS